MPKQIRPSLKAFLIGLIFTAAWGAAVAIAIALKLGDDWKRGSEVGAIVGGSLFLLYQPPLGRAVLALVGKIPHHKLFFSPITLVYFVGSWPGLLIGRLFKQIEFVKPVKPGEASPRKSPALRREAPTA
jgi:hypothetical protein